MPTVTILPPGHRSPRPGEPDYGGLNGTSGDDGDDFQIMVEHPRCNLNNWDRRVYDNCNTFHEQALERFSLRDSPVKVQYLASGSYCDALLLVQEQGLKVHGFYLEKYDFHWGSEIRLQSQAVSRNAT
jgi:hypothetical protein